MPPKASPSRALDLHGYICKGHRSKSVGENAENVIQKIGSQFNYGWIVPVIHFYFIDADLPGEIGKAETTGSFSRELGQNQTGKKMLRITDGFQQSPSTIRITDL